MMILDMIKTMKLVSLVLPSRVQSGFNNVIIAELRTIENFSEQEKYCVLLMDEMKVQEDLVWDKHTGDLNWICEFG